MPQHKQLLSTVHRATTAAETAVAIATAAVVAKAAATQTQYAYSLPSIVCHFSLFSIIEDRQRALIFLRVIVTGGLKVLYLVSLSVCISVSICNTAYYYMHRNIREPK